MGQSYLATVRRLARCEGAAKSPLWPSVSREECDDGAWWLPCGLEDMGTAPRGARGADGAVPGTTVAECHSRLLDQLVELPGQQIKMIGERLLLLAQRLGILASAAPELLKPIPMMRLHVRADLPRTTLAQQPGRVSHRL